MKKQILLNFCLLALLLLGSTQVVHAQGSTTSTLKGLVADTNGEPLIGATVVATHIPTGSVYGTVTQVDGRYNMPNMKVGGPYQVVVSYVGFQDATKENVYLRLGERHESNFECSEGSVELDAVVVVGKEAGLMDQDKTGSETTIGEEQINVLPTVSRSLDDFTRLTPQLSVLSGGGVSIGGANNRYNAIFIDGAVNNDVFGLASSGTNGGQIGINPISVDAIQEFQVVLSPYDVSLGGFTGGGINAVTRSGSNTFEGSVYYFNKNENFVGKTHPRILDPQDTMSTSVLNDLREKVDDFSSNTVGFRLGGPIVKNKLFFFANVEIRRDQTPNPFEFSTYEGNSTETELEALNTKLKGLGYDPGGYLDQTSSVRSDKALLRLDYNLNQDHKLTLRHSYSNGIGESPAGSSSRSINFGNSGVYFPSTTNSTAFELNSILGDNLSNNLIVGFTAVRDDRDPMGGTSGDFPYVSIQDGSGSINFGSEQFSTANELRQNIFTLTDNLKIFKGKHIITVGTHNEFYDMYNLFIRQNYGVYEYNSLNDFMNDSLPSEYVRSYSLVDNITGDGSAAAAEFNALQIGVYGQDEMSVNEKLTITAGLRLDVPFFLSKPAEDVNFNTNTIPMIEAEGWDLKGAKAGSMPKPSIMVSPRVGFNFDVLGDNTTMLRGGLGLFTGRVPFVWPGGAYNNNGLSVGGTFQVDPMLDSNGDGSGDTPLSFNPDAESQPTTPDFGGQDAIPSGQIDLFSANFKYPQVFRASLAVDRKLPWDMVATLEGLYSKTINNIFYENINLKQSTANLTGTPDNRPIYNRSDEIDPTYGRVLLGSNTNKGYTYNITAQLQKDFDKGFSANIAYTYGAANAIFDGTSSQNSSQWRGVHSIAGRNFAEVGRSDFDMGSRIMAFLSYRLEYTDYLATTFSLFYNGQSGRPFSYIYNDRGNLTNEDSRERNLIYIPASASDIILQDITDSDGNVTRSAADQWAELDAYIANDSYLSENRGGYADKNSNRSPFTSNIDFRILQDIFLKDGKENKHGLQLSLDIFNLPNLLNKDWGVSSFVPFGNYELLDFEGFQADDTTPEFTFPEQTTDPWDIDDFFSRWRMQVGVRYLFN